jgi:hypothetical protein
MPSIMRAKPEHLASFLSLISSHSHHNIATATANTTAPTPPMPNPLATLPAAEDPLAEPIDLVSTSFEDFVHVPVVFFAV